MPWWRFSYRHFLKWAVVYNLGLATKMVEMNHTYCLIVYCSSSISSSIRIYPLSRPFVFSAQELSRIRLPGFVIVFCICWTMRIRMHRMRVRKMGIEDYSLACRSVSIHSLSSIGEVWRIISWKFNKKKANGMIESELGLTLHLCKKIRRGHTLLS